MQLRAEYYEKDQKWVIYIDDKELFTYSIEDVPLYIIEYFSDQKNLKELPEEEQIKFLNEFEDKIFPSEKFGKQLLLWLSNSLENVTSVDDIEELLTSDKENVTVSEYRIEIQDRVEKKKEQEKVESLLKDKNPVVVMDAINKKEPWIDSILKSAGFDIYNRNHLTNYVYPVLWKMLSKGGKYVTGSELR